VIAYLTGTESLPASMAIVLCEHVSGDKPRLEIAPSRPSPLVSFHVEPNDTVGVDIGGRHG
jgi:hypothetical protein